MQQCGFERRQVWLWRPNMCSERLEEMEAANGAVPLHLRAAFDSAFTVVLTGSMVRWRYAVRLYSGAVSTLRAQRPARARHEPCLNAPYPTYMSLPIVLLWTLAMNPCPLSAFSTQASPEHLLHVPLPAYDCTPTPCAACRPQQMYLHRPVQPVLAQTKKQKPARCPRQHVVDAGLGSRAPG